MAELNTRSKAAKTLASDTADAAAKSKAAARLASDPKLIDKVPKKAVKVVEKVAEEGVDVVSDVGEMAVTTAQEGVNVAGSWISRNVKAAAVGVVVINAGVFFALGYKVAVKRVEAKLEASYEEEFAKMREHFRSKEIARQDKGDLKTMAQGLGYEAPEPAVVAPPPPPDVLVESDVPVPGVTVNTANVFNGPPAEVVWDQASEEHLRNLNPNDPYIVSWDEFQENAWQASQQTLTMFDGDGVLVRDDDSIVDANKIDDMLGMNNLGRFGHGSNDPNTLYIYNPVLDALFEIVTSFGTYAQTVAGFEDDGEIRHSHQRRGWDE